MASKTPKKVDIDANVPLEGIVDGSIVAFGGVKGAFGEQAVIAAFGESVTTLPCELFSDVVQKVEDGHALYGVLPIENSTGGAINEVYDLLGHSRCSIVGECIVHARQSLLALPEAKLADIRRVYSHPQGLRQCRNFLGDQHWEEMPFSNTAAAAQFVAESARKDWAAIASKHAAKCYGLQILAPDIHDRSDNFTRFVVISRHPIAIEGRCKASIAFTVKHEKGALRRVMSLLETKELNVNKLESRNIPGNPWEYRFYLDFEGEIDQRFMEELFVDLSELTAERQLLGCYHPAISNR